MDIKNLLQLVIDKKASDLHLIVGSPPTLRISGKLVPIPREGVLTLEAVQVAIKAILNPRQLERLLLNKEIDFSLAFSEKGRFRGNAYTQKNTWAVALRLIPLEIPTIDSLLLPRTFHNFVNLQQGFILVTGPTGHGKSTTIAAILDEINMKRAVHIVTIEDPIEFVFQPKSSVISQREMGNDSLSWNVALRSVLREDPNVVLVGEMRDHETISSALTVAETGHLVFATLHTNSASQTIDRIVDVFPGDQQSQVRMQLSGVIAAVISQRLVPAIDGGRVAAHEIMTATSAIKTSIRDGKTHQIDSIIQTSSEAGMNTLEASLANLVRDGRITVDSALEHSIRREQLNRLLKRT